LLFVIEMPLANVLSKMEATGLCFLPSRLTEMERQLNLSIANSATIVKKYAENAKFNVASPAQISDLLFQKLKLHPVGGKSAKNTHNSTSNAVLSTLVNSHPIIQPILDFRGASKLLTTYLRPLAAFARKDPLSSNPAEAVQRRIYPTWNQTAVATGRLSCRKPNIQTLPKVTQFNVCVKVRTKTRGGGGIINARRFAPCGSASVETKTRKRG